MPITEDRALLFFSDGRAELQVDRICLGSGPERRMKVLRRNVRVDDVFPDIRSEAAFVPRECRFAICDSQRQVGLYVIEQLPQVRSVGWSHNVTQGWDSVVQRGKREMYGLTEADISRRRFRLAFPYVVFVIPWTAQGMASFHVYFRPAPLRSIWDDLYHPSITNYDSTNSKMCLGQFNYDQGDILTLVDKAIGHFWSAGFNGDWSQMFGIYQQEIPELKTVFDWEFWSLTDPSWVLSAQWKWVGSLMNCFRNFLEGQRLLQRQGESRTEVCTQLFWNAQAAPELVERRPEPLHGFVPSQTLSAVLGVGNEIFSVEQKVVALQDLSALGIKKGEEYQIEAFSEADAEGIRLVKFSGIAEPIYADASWHACFQAKEGRDTTGKIVVVDNIRLFPGRWFCMRNNVDIPSLHPWRAYEISQVRLDQDGDVQVQVFGLPPNWVYLTYDNGRRLPSVEFVLPVKILRGHEAGSMAILQEMDGKDAIVETGFLGSARFSLANLSCALPSVGDTVYLRPTRRRLESLSGTVVSIEPDSKIRVEVNGRKRLFSPFQLLLMPPMP